MGKCGVFIPYHSHQAIPISIPMKLTWRVPFSWESHGTHGTHGNFQYIFISSLHRKSLVRRGGSLTICCRVFMLVSYVVSYLKVRPSPSRRHCPHLCYSVVENYCTLCISLFNVVTHDSCREREDCYRLVWSVNHANVTRRSQREHLVCR